MRSNNDYVELRLTIDEFNAILNGLEYWADMCAEDESDKKYAKRVKNMMLKYCNFVVWGGSDGWDIVDGKIVINDKIHTHIFGREYDFIAMTGAMSYAEILEGSDDYEDFSEYIVVKCLQYRKNKYTRSVELRKKFEMYNRDEGEHAGVFSKNGRKTKKLFADLNDMTASQLDSLLIVSDNDRYGYKSSIDKFEAVFGLLENNKYYGMWDD